jgi:hypothetical protein
MYAGIKGAAFPVARRYNVPKRGGDRKIAEGFWREGGGSPEWRTIKFRFCL